MKEIQLAQWDTSRQLFERSSEFLAGGVSSNVRTSRKPWPLFYNKARAARIYDADENEYVDYQLGQGPLLIGHSPVAVIEAVQNAVQEGQLYGGQHVREISLAEKICKLIPSAELVRFGSSGSEMVQAAIRLARAHTGKQKILKFEGHYHGWLDNVFVSVSPDLESAGAREAPLTILESQGQDPSAGDNIIVLPWNDSDLLRSTLEAHGDELAAVIMEPVMCNTYAIRPRPGYLEETRRVCDKHGVLLIFDEVITGFRLGLGGAQTKFGVTPHLSIFGKAMASGFPISALAGKREVMAHIAPGKVVHSGTYNSNVAVMAAAEATLDYLMEHESLVYSQMDSLGSSLMNGFREIGKRAGVPLLVEGFPAAFAVAFTDSPHIQDYREFAQFADRKRYNEFAQALLAHGIHVATRGIWYLSTMHQTNDIDMTLSAFEKSIHMLGGGSR